MFSRDSENSSNIDLLFDLWRLINFKRKKQIIILMLLTTISSLSEILSLVTVIPFLQVLIQPEEIYKFKIVEILLNYFGLNNSDQILFSVTTLFVGSAILTALIRLSNLWVSNLIAAKIGIDFSYEAFKVILYKPYKFHIQRNSSETINTTTQEISSTVEVISLFLSLITSSLIVAGLVFGLILINWQIAIFSILLFSFSYFLIAYFTRKILVKNSKYILRNSISLIKAAQEGLGSIKDVLIHNAHKTYLDLYRSSDRPVRLKQAENASIQGSPRFLIEAIGIILISLLAYFLTTKGTPKYEIISSLGTLALAAQRLLPAMQNVYTSWASIKSNIASVNKVTKILNSSKNINLNNFSNKRIGFKNEIKFENVSFRYSKDTPWVLNSINLTIKKGEKVGIVGETGCGKSTFLDIMMGLLEPTKGKIYVDNICITCKSENNLTQSWRNLIAHVPQDIYLSDTTVLNNIAFGIENNQINFDKVRLSARKAKIANFIDSKPQGFRSIVGERGISLSGGQIQRIGIARALYKDAEILIMDEATSALDNKTEEKIISEISSLSENLTILMVAHRLTTLNNCDRLITFKDGRITK
tara:strand:+ start:1606 stop:3369 length:1764 start_codon:yes stop_codon:yes gene_type:complete